MVKSSGQCDDEMIFQQTKRKKNKLFTGLWVGFQEVSSTNNDLGHWALWLAIMSRGRESSVSMCEK